jgi:hypothetical protein
MAAIGLLSLGALVATAVGAFRAFSYIAALLIVGVIASSSIERGTREFALEPYRGLIWLLAAAFLAGVTAIWLLWSPGQTEYEYVLGVPRATLAYLLLLWIVPLGGAVLYSLRFPAIGSGGVVDDIMERARSAQDERRLPLAPERTSRESDDR